MKKLIALVGLGLTALAGMPLALAHADPLSPSVEGNGYMQGGMVENQATVVWGCTALATGGRATATEVTCELWKHDQILHTETVSGVGNAAATVPRVHSGGIGGLRVCWKAEAKFDNGVDVEDKTLPNCTS